METFVSEWLAGSANGGTLLRVKELEEQQQALLKSVICAFNPVARSARPPELAFTQARVWRSGQYESPEN